MEDIVKEVRERADEAWQPERDNRREAAIDLDFLANRQWPEAIRQERTAADRPVLTVNQLPQFLRQVTNDIRQNIPVVKCIPANEGADEKIARVFEGLIRQIQYASSASHVYAMAAEHQAACGMGHFRIVTQYVEDGFEQEIAIKPVTAPLSVYWDPAAVEPDRSDAMWCIVTDMVPRKAFERQYPGKAPSDVDVPMDGENGLWWGSEDSVRRAEYWRKVPSKRWLVALANGETIDLSDFDDQERAIVRQMGVVVLDDGQPVPIVNEREVDGHKVEQWIVTGDEVLSGPNAWAGRHIPIVPVIGAEIALERGVYRYGLIRMSRDSQQLYNYWLTCAAEMIALAPKPKWLVTDAMVKDYLGEWHRAHLDAKPFLRFKPDNAMPGGVPQRQMPPEMPAAFLQMASIARDDMKASIGIYDAALGARSNETSGKAIMARQREGDVATYHFADNLKRSLEYAGRILVDLIPKIYDTERTIRILGEEDDVETVTINRVLYSVDGQPQRINDLSVGRYDVRVTIGPSFTTKRVEAAESMMQFLQGFPQAAPLIGDLVAKNMDWPGAETIAERLKRMVPPQALSPEEQQQMGPPPAPPGPPPEAQAKAFELEMGTKQADIEKTRAETEAKRADTALKVRELQMPVLGPVTDLRGSGPPA